MFQSGSRLTYKHLAVGSIILLLVISLHISFIHPNISLSLYTSTFGVEVIKTSPTQNITSELSNGTQTTKQIKYMLIWTDPQMSPMDYLLPGDISFTKNSCTYTNCYVTGNRKYFDDITKFDAVLFNGKTITDRTFKGDLPSKRTPNQKYVFAAMESAHYYPIRKEVFANYFNWTWTYRIDSDYRWNYITIYDLNGTEIGPAADIEWPELKPITEDVRSKLRSKQKAAAWIVSNCNSKGGREKVVKAMEEELSKYDYHVDIYGSCGRRVCPRRGSKANICYQALQKDYYFYLSFENSLDTDYVTEKLLTALDNFVVPIVYGGANYSRFLPPGSYLTATLTNSVELVKEMIYLINNRTAYEEYFRWRNHFVYKATLDNKDLCTMCNALNEHQNETTVKSNLMKWWNVNHPDYI